MKNGLFDSIFGKQFAAYAVSLIVSFALLGLVLSNLLESYLYDRQIAQLTERGAATAHSYVQYVQMDMAAGGFGGRGNILAQQMARERAAAALENLANDLVVLNRYFGASLFVVDNEMNVMFTSGDIEAIQLGQTLDAKELMPALGGSIITLKGDIGGIFNERMVTVGYPIVYSDGEVLGAIFMNTSMAEIEKTIFDIILIIGLCLFAALAVSFIIAYFISRSISKPIKQISDAAIIISGGNFDKRITVKSGGEVGRLIDSFNHMAENLDNNERTRNEFIANISHDLRSPLTSLRGFLTAVIDGTVEDGQRQRYLNIILDETDRLTKLTNDIMEVNSINKIANESGSPLRTTVFDINRLLIETMIVFEARINEKGIEVEFVFGNDKYAVDADMQAIRRVIVNIADNAVKFAPQNGGKIVVTARLAGDKIRVGIKDNGIGIGEADQKRVFERFYKADASRGEDRRGNGLGLAIAYGFVKAHGEEITVNSEAGKGCEVVFTLTPAY
jgi:signal transduction histidine kinase